MSSPGVTFYLTCGKDVTELKNLTNLRLSSFAESYQMQQKNFDISPNGSFNPRVPRWSEENIALAGGGWVGTVEWGIGGGGGVQFTASGLNTHI